MRKFMLLTLLLLLTLGTGVTAYAQRGDMMDDRHGRPVFCGDLSEEDCTLYEELSGGVVPDSTAFDLAVDATIVAEGSTFDFAIDADGAYVYEVEVVRDYLDSIADVPLLEVDTEVLVGFVESGINAFDAELGLTIELPAPIAMFLPSETIDLDFWLVDGVAYTDLTPIGALAEDESIAGVYGIDAFELIRMGLSEVTLGDLFEVMDDADFDDMRRGDFGGNFQQNFMPAQLNPREIAEFATFTRLEDGDVDGVETAVFETVIDVPALFENRAIRRSVADNLRQQGADIDPEALSDALVEALAGSEIVVTEAYGIEDGYLYASSFNMDVVVDPASLEALDDSMDDMGDMEEEMDDMGMATEEAMDDMDMEMEEEMPEPIEFSVEAAFTRSDINAVEAITLPDGAQIVPTEDLIGLASGM